MEPGEVTILDGSTFIVSDARGDVDAGPAQVQGLFYRDMRHLSTWRLLLDGRPLEALASDLVAYDCAAFFLVVPTGTVYASPTVSLIRRRTVGDGMREQLTVRSSSAKALAVQVMMVFGSDFADIFEVKDAETKKGSLQVFAGDGSAVLSYARGDFGRQTTITAPGAVFSRGSFLFPLVLEPGQTWTGEITVAVGQREATVSPKLPSFHSAPTPNMGTDLVEWVAAAPSIDCDWDGLRHIYERSITDLAALRFYPDVVAGTDSLPAAGLPWFMALFGRDSLLTSYQALPFVPELAATPLRALAARQASEVDDFRDAEPGKILHELRFGELTPFRERPQSPYYGSADATPLFLILLDEYERWTGDRDLVRSLERPARAALGWIETYGDRDGDGYVEYERRNQQSGLEN